MAPTPGEEPLRVMELYEVLRTLRWAQKDARIRGIFADFSSLHVPSGISGDGLGLAQIEELRRALEEFRRTKKEQYGEKITTVAWTDSFSSQGAYLLASAFDRVYVQPAGEVPLTGLSAHIPFYRRLLDWAGIKVHAEARNEYKSMVSPFVERDSLPPAQLKNQAELIGELNYGYANAIGKSRFPELGANEATDRVLALAQGGPYSAKEAAQLNLIDGVSFKRDALRSLSGPALDDSFKALHHYFRITDRALSKTVSEDEVVQVGVIYLLGGISSAPGEFSVSSAIRGLTEAARDDDIRSIVLRIDSGGGDVVASESLWDAVRRVRIESNKSVVVSFGNMAASGGYYVATAGDAIFACENTITGSIGVAALRPTLTKTLFERLNLRVQSFFSGSTSMSSLHEPNEKQLRRMQLHIDAAYADFLEKVKEGRGLAEDALHGLVGGRVLTGLAALGEVPLGDAVPSFGKEYREPSRGQVEWWPHKDDDGTVIISDKQPAGWLASILPNKHDEDHSDDNVEGHNDLDDEHANVPNDDVAPESHTESDKPAKELTLTTAIGALTSLDTTDDYAAPGAPPNEYKSRGLVDALGGIMDAAHYAMTLSLQSEINELAEEEGVSIEEAAKRIRPYCDRVVTGDKETIVTDLELVRFPKSLPLWRRIQQYSVRGEHPFIELIPFIFGSSSDVVKTIEELRHMRHLRSEYPYTSVL
ncbi:hypothetical protein MCUN1_003182 [Malassezia cuniculi]|uniref:Peptidase S49 domain-containing protein n=1 Tax=Malassezia cuniculi TaxID=948313 RepID=A0AAF0ESN2_9BASI|nr:hypothetical protein MCUN1_003182 [Malassezia cuniculi]